MLDVLFYLIVFAIIAGMIVGGAYLVRSYMTGTLPQMQFFAPRADRRLDVMERTNLDGTRRLVLIRRDDVEHLIMTGGPVDVVIETGIGQRRAPAEIVEAPTIYARQPRRFGQAVGEN